MLRVCLKYKRYLFLKSLLLVSYISSHTRLQNAHLCNTRVVMYKSNFYMMQLTIQFFKL